MKRDTRNNRVDFISKNFKGIAFNERWKAKDYK